jgi:hypothetical protein
VPQHAIAHEPAEVEAMQRVEPPAVAAAAVIEHVEHEPGRRIDVEPGVLRIVERDAHHG